MPDARAVRVYTAARQGPLAKTGEKSIMRNREGYAEQEGNEPVIPERYKDDFTDFEPLELDPAERKALETLHERVAATGYEYGQVRSENGFSEVFTSAKHDRVAIPDELKQLNELSLYHGHTNVTPLSTQDLRLLTQGNVDKVAVIASNGDVFSAQIGDGWRPSLEDFEAELDLIEEETLRALMEDEDFFSWSVPERKYMAVRERAYRIARRFGWRLEGGRS